MNIFDAAVFPFFSGSDLRWIAEFLLYSTLICGLLFFFIFFPIRLAKVKRQRNEAIEKYNILKKRLEKGKEEDEE